MREGSPGHEDTLPEYKKHEERLPLPEEVDNFVLLQSAKEHYEQAQDPDEKKKYRKVVEMFEKSIEKGREERGDSQDSMPEQNYIPANDRDSYDSLPTPTSDESNPMKWYTQEDLQNALNRAQKEANPAEKAKWEAVAGMIKQGIEGQKISEKQAKKQRLAALEATYRENKDQMTEYEQNKFLETIVALEEELGKGRE